MLDRPASAPGARRLDALTASVLIADAVDSASDRQPSVVALLGDERASQLAKAMIRAGRAANPEVAPVAYVRLPAICNAASLSAETLRSIGEPDAKPKLRHACRHFRAGGRSVIVFDAAQGFGQSIDAGEWLMSFLDGTCATALCVGTEPLLTTLKGIQGLRKHLVLTIALAD